MLDRTIEHISLKMYMPRLQAPAPIAFPGGYSVRFFRPGDEAHWARIETAASEFVYERKGLEAFERYYGQEKEFLPERMLFVLDKWGLPVGTATAWFEGAQGRLHWVGIEEKHQGKGLARPMLQVTMLRMADLGHTDAFLTTQTSSWVAIRLYLEMGFTPVIDTALEARGWQLVKEKLEARG